MFGSLVVKYFGEAVLRPLACCAQGQLPPSAPAISCATVTSLMRMLFSCGSVW